MLPQSGLLVVTVAEGVLAEVAAPNWHPAVVRNMIINNRSR
jgi:hypothetical protein